MTIGDGIFYSIIAIILYKLIKLVIIIILVNN